jgi:hypothetical protein
MPLTFTLPIEGLEDRQLSLATWVNQIVLSAPKEFEELEMEDFIFALAGIFKIDLQTVLVCCMGKTNEMRQ